MSTVCVFGLKYSDCLKKAVKQIPDIIKKRVLTVAEHGVYANLLAEHMYADDECRVVQISPLFDAKHFADEWRDIAEKTKSARRMKIMAKVFERDGAGNLVIRKGKKVSVWREI